MEPQESTSTSATATAPGRHPLAPLCAAFAAGAWTGLRHPHALDAAVAGSAVALVAWAVCAIAARRRRRWNPAAAAALFAATFAVACVSGQLAARDDYEAVELFRAIEDSREDAVIRGRVDEAPTLVRLGPGAARARFRLRVKELPHEAGAIAVADAVVLVDWYGPESMVRGAQSFRLPAAGEGWQLNGRMREVSLRAGAPRVTFKVRGKSPSTHRHPAMDASGLAMKLWELRGYAERILSLGMADRREQTGLVKAMTLGLRSDVPREVMDVFKGSGTVHVFSISGLHVAIVSSILVAGLSALPLRLAHRVFVFAPMIAAYTLATGAAPSAVRACVMALILFSAPLAGRRLDPVSSVCAAALLLLARDPRELLDLGFVFSFVCTAGIVLMVPLFTEATAFLVAARSRRAEDPPPLEAPDGRAAPRWRAMALARWRGLLRFLRGGFCVSLAAWIASTPVTAVYFDRIVPSSLLANLLVVPLSEAMVATAALSLVSGLFSPWLAETFNHANAFLADCLVKAAAGFAHMPMASVEAGRWTTATVVAWYAGTIALMLLLRAALERRDRD